MKRLTEKNESPCTCCGGIGSCRTDCSYKQIYDRLAEYEDTGLTPKEIEDMVSVREITPEAEYAIDKHANNLIQKLNELITKTDEKNELQRYKDAEEKGLLLRLPCKVGDTVYRIVDRGYLKDTCETDCYSCDILCPYEGREYERVIEIKPWKMANIPMIANAMEKLGKTVFLTREEAEKALEGMKNEA